jgi:hypothetical protein
VLNVDIAPYKRGDGWALHQLTEDGGLETRPRFKARLAWRHSLAGFHIPKSLVLSAICQHVSRKQRVESGTWCHGIASWRSGDSESMSRYPTLDLAAWWPNYTVPRSRPQAILTVLEFRLLENSTNTTFWHRAQYY